MNFRNQEWKKKLKFALMGRTLGVGKWSPNSKQIKSLNLKTNII